MNMNLNLYNYGDLQSQIENYLESLSPSIIIFICFFLLVIVAGVIIFYVFSSLGIMEAAKKNNLEYPWLAFIPVARVYLVAKLGFEVYLPKEKKNQTLTWVTLVLSIASIVLQNYLINLALTVFISIAFYNIFSRTTKKYKAYTVFTVLFGENLAGIFLYCMKKDLISGAELQEEEPITKSLETIKEEMKATPKNKYCSECGTKVLKNAKFCTNCGKEIK